MNTQTKLMKNISEKGLFSWTVGINYLVDQVVMAACTLELSDEEYLALKTSLVEGNAFVLTLESNRIPNSGTEVHMKQDSTRVMIGYSMPSGEPHFYIDCNELLAVLNSNPRIMPY